MEEQFYLMKSEDLNLKGSSRSIALAWAGRLEPVGNLNTTHCSQRLR